MNKNKKNRKGFTIVELVIVIAVIGILATVLVPTFGDVIADAKESAAIQEAKNLYTNYVADVADTAEYADDAIVAVSSTQFVVVDNGAVSKTIYTSADAALAALEATNAANATATAQTAVGKVTPVKDVVSE